MSVVLVSVPPRGQNIQDHELNKGRRLPGFSLVMLARPCSFGIVGVTAHCGESTAWQTTRYLLHDGPGAKGRQDEVVWVPVSSSMTHPDDVTFSNEPST